MRRGEGLHGRTRPVSWCGRTNRFAEDGVMLADPIPDAARGAVSMQMAYDPWRARARAREIAVERFVTA